MANEDALEGTIGCDHQQGGVTFYSQLFGKFFRTQHRFSINHYRPIEISRSLAREDYFFGWAGCNRIISSAKALPIGARILAAPR